MSRFEVGAESYHIALGRRVKRVTAFLTDNEKVALSVTVGLISQPVDALVLTLLRLDDAGEVLADVTSRIANPLRSARVAFLNLLRQGLVSDTITLQSHLNERQQEHHMDTMRGLLVELSAVVHYRVDLYLSRSPFLLVGLVHPDRTNHEQHSPVEDFYKIHECCLDPHFGKRLRSRSGSAKELME